MSTFVFVAIGLSDDAKGNIPGLELDEFMTRRGSKIGGNFLDEREWGEARSDQYSYTDWINPSVSRLVCLVQPLDILVDHYFRNFMAGYASKLSSLRRSKAGMPVKTWFGEQTARPARMSGKIPRRYHRYFGRVQHILPINN